MVGGAKAYAVALDTDSDSDSDPDTDPDPDTTWTRTRLNDQCDTPPRLSRSWSHVSAEAGEKSGRTFLWWRWLERPSLAVPALYALSTSIGMLFQWAYYNALGIDILHYVDPTDLLMASFRQPTVWLLLLVAIVAVQFDNFCSARFGRRERALWLAWYGTPTYRRANLLVGVLLVVFLIVLWAQLSAHQTASGNGRAVQIVFAEDGTSFDGSLIGTSNRFLFLRDPATDAHLAYPFEALRSIQLTGIAVAMTAPVEPAVVGTDIDPPPATETESEDEPTAD